MLGQYWIA